METIVKLNVSARDLFAIMEQSLLQEVKAATNKNVDATQKIPGPVRQSCRDRMETRRVVRGDVHIQWRHDLRAL